MVGLIQSRNGNNGSASGIYRSQGVVEAGALKNLVITASEFISNNSIRDNFLGNAEAFTDAQLEVINGDFSMQEKNLALSYLRQEQDYLERQIAWLNSKQVKPAASIEVRIINGMVSYIVKGIGLVGGVLQVIGGATMIFAGSPTVIGSAVGALLVLHGINNIIESSESLFIDNDSYEGPMTKFYEGTAGLLGIDRTYGKIAFAGIDLILSAYTLLGTKLVPDAWRLLQYIPADYELNFRVMSAWELAGEIFPDSATFFSLNQTYFSLPVNQPDDPSNPRFPFPKE